MLPNNELRAILNHVVGRYIRLEDCTERQRAWVDNLALKRLTGMPLAKIIGTKEFWKHHFITTENTLDPRPDSETLIEAVLKICPPTECPDVTDSSASHVESVNTKIQNAAMDPSSAICDFVRKPSSVKPYRILDLGTGTGCLLMSLLTEYPDATGVGVDISEKALAVAKRNADVILNRGDERVSKRESISYNTTGSFHLTSKQRTPAMINGSSVSSAALAEDGDGRIKWIQSNWCANLSGIFDIIICNPPYIDPSEPINTGAAFDPPIALYGGVHTYETILKSIDQHLECKPKHLFFEIGYTQATPVSALLQDYGYQNIEIFKDLSNHNRVVYASA